MSSRKMTAPAPRRGATGTRRARRLRRSRMHRGIRAPAGRAARIRPLIKRRRAVAQRHHAAATHAADHAFGRGVDLAHDARAVDHDHAVLHVLDHQLVDLRHVGKVDLALSRQPLAGHRADRQGMRKPGGREIGNREQPGLRILGAAFGKTQHFVGVLEQHRNGRDGGKKKGQLAAGHQPCGGQRRQQQQAEAAGQSAAGVHQQHHESDVAAHLDRELPGETLAGADHREHREGERGVTRCGKQEQAHVARTELQRGAPERRSRRSSSSRGASRYPLNSCSERQ
jgi:hypothetical protein